MKHCLWILILIFFGSCTEPQIYFSKSQPENKGKESKIKKKFWGQYESLSDSSILEISSDKIIRKYHPDSIYSDTLNGVLTFKNIKISELDIQTIFSFDKPDELKFAKGIYFINKFKDKNKWSLTLLKERHNGYIELLKLCIGEPKFTFDSLSPSCDVNEIQNLNNWSIIKVVYKNLDSTRITEYQVEIKKSDLIKYIQDGGFLDVEVFKKLNNCN